MVVSRVLTFFILTYFTASFVAGDHEDEHTENPSISLDYETVTEIINALDPDTLDSETFAPESNEDSSEDTEVMVEVTPSNDLVDNYAYGHPEESFQKRKSYKKPRQVRKKIVISSQVDLPEDEHLIVKPKYYPDYEPVDPEQQIPDAPCDTVVEETYHSSDTIEEQYHSTGEESYGYVGSQKGKPGVDYPNYTEIPMTSFTCADKKHIPGFYADLETRCQVFHVCYPQRRESFLCPVGTTFNQPIKACDYWYNGNCSASPQYFDVNEDLNESQQIEDEDVFAIVEEIFPEEVASEEPPCESPEPPHIQPPEVIEKPVFVEVPEPVISKPIVEIPVKPVPKPVVIPIPQPVVVQKPIDPVKVVSIKKFVPIKAKVVKFAAPLAVKKVKVVAAKPLIKMAKAVPVIKMLKAAAVVKKPVLKTILLKSAPVVKPLLLKKPIVAKKIFLTKVAKAKVGKILVKKAAVSALTKKHLALSLMRMLQAHKLNALHGGARRRRVYYL